MPRHTTPATAPAARFGCRSAAALACALLLGSGCVVGPDFVPPQPSVADRWHEATAEGTTDEPVDYGAWWKGFDDQVLNRLVETAYRENLTLQVAAIRVLEARARLGVVRGLRGPQQQELAGQSVRVELSDNAPNAALLDRSFWSHQLGFDAAWELDFWGRYRRGVEAAGAGYLATIAGYEAALVTVTAELARAYVLLRTFEERLAVARRNVEVQRGSLRMAEIRYRNGLATELDVAQATALLLGTQALIPRLEAGLLQSGHAIATLIGRPPGDLSDILAAHSFDADAGDGTPRTRIPTPPPDIAVGTPVDLLRRRPDVRRAELEAAAQSARIGIAKSDLYPRFALIGSIGLASSADGGAQSGDAALGDLLDSSSVTYRVGPVFSWPILNYGRLRNNVRIQDARFQQLVIAYKNTVLDAAREVEDALATYLLSQIRSRHLGGSVESAKRSVELALTQYRAGLVTYQRVLDTQAFLLQQEDRLAETKGNVALNLIATYKALGGGWEIHPGRHTLSPEIQEEMRARTHWGPLLPPTLESQSEEHER
jgi:NodT family efflux transporter outer membrane factor (OMF) lipoprotein